MGQDKDAKVVVGRGAPTEIKNKNHLSKIEKYFYNTGKGGTQGVKKCKHIWRSYLGHPFHRSWWTMMGLSSSCMGLPFGVT